MATYLRHVKRLVSTDIFLSRRNDIFVESKRFVRGLRRKPVKVLCPQNETETVRKPAAKAQAAAGDVRKDSRAQVTATSRRHHGEEEDSVQETVRHPQTKDTLDGLYFERAYSGDKRLARLVSIARSKAVREHQGKILLEGRRLICDALDAGANPQMVFFSTVDRLRELPVDKLKRATLVKVKFEDIKIWSDLVTPQGLIAIFSRPNPSRLNFSNRGHSVPLSLICDNIRDPGNLGTMLRCAAAAGCHNVLLTKGCVDAWEPKVLRAAMGAHFRLPIYPSLDWDDIESHLPEPVTVHVADSSCGANTSGETEDSINIPSHKHSKAGDYGWVSKKSAHDNRRHEEYDTDSDSDSDSDSEFEGLSLPRVDSKLYHERWAQSPTALVIGGETHGLSEEAVQLAGKTAGHRLFIPIVPDVDSLNSAMAASILLFEGRKQLLKIMQTRGRKWKPAAGQQSS